MTYISQSSDTLPAYLRSQNIDGLEEKAGLTYGVPDPTPSRPRESRTLSSEARSRKRKRDQNELPPAPPSTPPVSVCGDHNLEDDDKNIHQHSDRAQCVTCSSQSDLSGSEMCSQASTASTLCPTQAHSSSSDKIPAALSQVKTRAAAMADAARAPSVAIQPRPVRPKPVDPFPRVIPLHGTLKHLTCSICKHSKLMSECIPALSAGELIHCSQCENFDAARTISGFRPRGVGVLKSGVVLYGEEHTEGELVGQVTSRDLMRGRRPDLLIVAGTTLKVPGTKRLVKELSKVIRPPSKEAHDSDEADDEDRLCASSKKAQPIHTIFLNNEFPTPGGLWKDTFDVWIKGDLGKFIDMVSQERIHQEELKAKRALDKIERERRKEEKLNKTAQQEKDDPSLSQTSTATTSVKLPSTPRRKKTVQTSDLPTTAKLPSIPKGKKAIKTTVPLTKVPSATTNVQKSVAKFFPISKAGTAPANIGKRSGPKLTKAPTKPKATSAAKRAPKAGAARTVAV